MSSIEVSCPSGLRLRMRGMKVKDEQLFANRKLAQSGRLISELLRVCFEEVLDMGPYSFDGPPIWDQLLASDRTYALIQVRIASYGSDYEFRVTCDACRHVYGWGVDLDDLDVIPVSEQGIEHVRSGQPIPVELCDGSTVMCRLSTGEDEAYLAGLGAKDEHKILTYSLARRITTLNGKDRFKSIVGELEELPAKVGDDLWNKTDDLEGGVETSFDVECPRCGSDQQVSLPFEAGFFSTKRRFARSKTKSNG